ncbi:transmembrane signal receptor [Lithospermum erythrorhizon]|uniref:Transmembrane signal receptor n=1 Tax=Lithospermum erythrorhizon TaxID=34254 RepID=A0AAV3QER4_LITER
MKGVRHGNLYPLVGTTVTSDLAVGVVGHKDQTKCTRIWHMRLGHMSEKGLSLLSGQEDSKFIISRDVTFDERSMVALSKATVPQNGDVKTVNTQVNLVEYALSVDDDEPVTFKQAIKDKDRESWLIAMEEEIQSLHKNKTWEVVPLLVGKTAIGCKWVYKRKEDPSKPDSIRYKARLVAKRFAQKEGVDYNEIFSPVVKHTSIRVLLSLVARGNLELEQLDVKTTFLHGDLDEEIYMYQPEGYKVEAKESQVCCLRKSLYGLKQSPR